MKANLKTCMTIVVSLITLETSTTELTNKANVCEDVHETPSGLRTSNKPPILWEFPGSGGVWARKLIELRTSWMTGTMFSHYKALEKYFVGEKQDYKSQKFAAIYTSASLVGNNLLPEFKERNLIIFGRDPYRAILQTAIYDGVLTEEVLNQKTKWLAWRKYAIEKAQEYANMWRSYEAMIKHGLNYTFIPYEWLTSRGDIGRGLTYKKNSWKSLFKYIGHENKTRENCSIDANFIYGDKKPLLQKLTPEMVYKDRHDDTSILACDMWKEHLKDAAQIAKV
eukprot:m.61857 g.61857  ORF g.61857 m.61857 type:complete len:281 (-) comp11456_c0_seq2:925-1767(-)